MASTPDLSQKHMLPVKLQMLGPWPSLHCIGEAGDLPPMQVSAKRCRGQSAQYDPAGIGQRESAAVIEPVMRAAHGHGIGQFVRTAMRKRSQVADFHLMGTNRVNGVVVPADSAGGSVSL